MKKTNKSRATKEIALQRAKELLDRAEKVFNEDKALANRYVTLARKIAMKFRASIPSAYKRKFCKHCYKFLKPGTNCRVRTQRGKVVYYCLECNKYTRFPYN